MRVFGITSFVVCLLFCTFGWCNVQPPNLRDDPKLQAKITLVELNPDLSSVFERFEKATGLKFTLDQRIKDHSPKLGGFQLKDVHVWAIMGLIPRVGLEEGRWEKTADGYMLTAKASLALAPAGGKGDKGKADHDGGGGDKYYLRRDPKLQAKVTIVAGSPLLVDVLARLQAGTGLSITADEGVAKARRDLGSLQLRDVPAWAVMEFLAQYAVEKGRWDKVEGGYRLMGQVPAGAVPVAAQPSAAPESSPWLWCGVAAVTLGAFGGGFYAGRRRWRKAVSPERQAVS